MSKTIRRTFKDFQYTEKIIPDKAGSAMCSVLECLITIPEALRSVPSTTEITVVAYSSLQMLSVTSINLFFAICLFITLFYEVPSDFLFAIKPALFLIIF